MKLLFKERIFTFLDSYDVYDEAGNTVFTAEGELSWGHCLRILDAYGNEVGMVQQKPLAFFPECEIYIGGERVGSVSKEFALFASNYDIDYRGWYVKGDFLEWDYEIFDENGDLVATISKELLNWSDTYVIDVKDPRDALDAMMLVIAIDVEKCSRK